MNFRQQRFHEIDGLRGIAALGVAFYHIHPYGTFWMRTFVDLFFVISGFVITGILLRLDAWDWPNLRNFWMRRILRIWPVYYLTLAGVLLLWFAWSIKHGQALRPFTGFWESTVFLHYIVGDYSTLPKGVNYLWWFGHSWSLAVEEQFYLLWPVVLWKWRTRPLTCIALLLAAAAGVLHVQANSALPDYLLVSRGTALILGTILAVVHHQREWRVAVEANPSALQNPFQRKLNDTRAGNGGSGGPNLARTAILIKQRTSRKSISASIGLFSPYSAGLERAKKTAFAALAACATMARINQRML